MVEKSSSCSKTPQWISPKGYRKSFWHEQTTAVSCYYSANYLSFFFLSQNKNKLRAYSHCTCVFIFVNCSWFSEKPKRKCEPQKVNHLRCLQCHTHCQSAHEQNPGVIREKQSVRRKKLSVNSNPEGPLVSPAPVTQGLMCGCRLHGRLCIRPACWGWGHIYLSQYNWHVGIDGGTESLSTESANTEPLPWAPTRWGPLPYQSQP